MDYEELANGFQRAARQLHGAAKKLSAQLPQRSGNSEICDARRCIEHYNSRLKKLSKELNRKRAEWPPLPGGR